MDTSLEGNLDILILQIAQYHISIGDFVCRLIFEGLPLFRTCSDIYIYISSL